MQPSRTATELTQAEKAAHVRKLLGIVERTSDMASDEKMAQLAFDVKEETSDEVLAKLYDILREDS